MVTVLADSAEDTLEFEQEVVEILAMDGEAVLAEAAAADSVFRAWACVSAPSTA
jgi:hypothetical protein